MQYTNLLKPGHIGSLKLKNRLIYSAMDLRSADGQGHMTQEAIDSLLLRAQHGPGLVYFPGHFAWSTPGVPHGKTLTLGDNQHIAPLRKTVQQVHAAGAKAGMEIYARGTRMEGNNQTIGPSPVRFGYDPGRMTRELSVGEIEQMVEWFGDAVARAREAEFDTVEIQACTGKLISMFLSPYSNHRQDEYGGSIENRTRFLYQILENARKKVGNDYPLTVRLGIDDLFPEGLQLEDGLKALEMINPLIDGVHVSVGTQEHIWNLSSSYFYKEGWMLPYTQRARQVTDKTVIAMGKLGTPALAEQTLADGTADFICLGRPLLTDPYWLEKAISGQEASIRKCIGCVNCFTFNDRKEIQPIHVSCTVNPELLREKEFAITAVAEPKKVLVIGGGLAGLQAALTAAQRGHQVTLAEATNQLGGQWLVASHAEYKADFKTLVPWLQQELAKTTAKIQLNTKVTKEYLQKFQPDAVILATGAIPKKIPFTAANGAPNSVTGFDVLLEQAQIGQRVVVIGGRYIGMEVAAKLGAQGKHVSVVDMTEIGKDTNPRILGIYRNKMVEHDVHLYPNCPVLFINERGVSISHLNSLLTLPADTVVFAMGTAPVQELVPVLEELHIPYYTAGDCRRSADALYAIRDGAEVGRQI